MGMATDHGHFSNFLFPQPKEAPYEIWAKFAEELQRRSRLKMLTDDGQEVIFIAHPEHSSGELINNLIWTVFKFIKTSSMSTLLQVSGWSDQNWKQVMLMIRIFLLVTPLKTFLHQDLWYGKLVPSSHQRGKPSHTILCTISGGNNRIWKGIPI